MLALSQAANVIEHISSLKAIIIFTASGRSARFVAAEKPKTLIYAVTPNLQVYHALNLLWGVIPLYMNDSPDTFEGFIQLGMKVNEKYKLALPGEKILVIGGLPAGEPGGTNFIKIQVV
jgi:pyruvate kinase